VVVAEPGQRYMIDAVGGGHVLLRRMLVRDELMRLDGGRAVAVGRGIDTTGAIGVDDGRIAIRRDDEIVWVALRDGRLTPAARWGGSVAVRDGHLLAVDHRGDGGWRIAELGADGPGVEIARVPAELGTRPPEIVCGAPPANRCLIYAATGAQVEGVILDGRSVGAIRPLPIEPGEFRPELSADGRRLATSWLKRGVHILDLGTNAEQTWRPPPGCLHQFLAWSRQDDGLLVSLRCAGQGQLVELRPGGTTKVTYSGTSWISSVITANNGETFVSLRSSMRDVAWVDNL